MPAFAGGAPLGGRPVGEVSSERTLNRRADVLAAYTAIRNGIVAEESEFRDELQRLFAVYTADAIDFSRRLPAIRAAREQREVARAERLGVKATLRLPVCIEDETNDRREIGIEEQRDRRRLARRCECDYQYVRLTEKLQLLVRAEDRKRYTLERNEAAAYQQIAFDYAQTPWKPTIKMLGQCPFARKAACPFSHRFKMCHGMPVSDEHYAR
eukprot:CAMPEP_0174834038 /NCGR_PEP_ID=MMETSP1114-20130205/4597_1 /TAXON_ID=312471 /ORGANISM="Neobodo designis, Strain CCAP 1951/1" /LENGTH=211 /DNA_ID=CAMNT_0016067943 /DNA_START=84 /DNA_END=715 /DNA_ORIENTATION=-